MIKTLDENEVKITAWEVFGYDKNGKKINLTDFITEDSAEMIDQDIWNNFEHPEKEGEF